MKNLIRKILKEDLEYWRVSDASPNIDEYKMGIEEDNENIKRHLTQGQPRIKKEDKQKSAYAKFIGEMAVKHSDIDEFSVKTSFGYRIPSFWFKNRYNLTIDRDFINRWYRYVEEEFGVHYGDYIVIEGAMSVFFDRIFDMYGVEDETEDVDDSDPEELNEDVPIYKEHNLGKKMYERLRKAYPMTPEYVLKDYFFNNIVGNYDYIKKEHYGDPLLVTRGSWDSYLKGPWSLEVLTVNPEDFDDNTVDAFIRRDFGNEEMFTVDNDLKRTKIQRRLAKPTGMNEPVIVELKPNGKYELVEGWHRTMSILLLGDNGEDLKNWDKVKIRAFVRDLSK